MVTAILDGDIIAYRAASVAQEDIDWGDGESTVSDFKQAIETADRMVREWAAKIKARCTYVCFSDDINYRKTVDSDYKAARTTEKPQAYAAVVEHLKSKFKCFTWAGLEADDVMGILSTRSDFGNEVIVSIDKDMMTIPGRFFNPLKDKRPVFIRAPAANRFWLTQVLTGDVTDGYKGCPGIGPKKAEKILGSLSNSVSVMWENIVQAYENAGLTEEDAIRNARLSRILRNGEYNQNTQEVKLWSPRGEHETLRIQDISIQKSSQSTQTVREAGKRKSRKSSNPSLVTNV